MSYDRKEIASEHTKIVAAELAANKLITLDQLTGIIEGFKTTLYTPSFFVRIGLFIFSQILINAAIGIIALAVSDLLDNELTAGILLVIAGLGLIGTLEYFIHTKHHYKSGIDDCLLYTAVLFLIAGLVFITGFYDALKICLLALSILIVAAWRYADSIVSLGAFICFYVSVFLTLKDFTLGRIWMPFVFFAISGIFSFIFNVYFKKDSLFYYENCLKVLKVASLLTLYLSMNYFVVKEGNLLLNDGVPRNATNDIPFAFIFLTITFILPVVYLIFGLKNKDRLLLWTGLGILILTIFTLKYRFEFLQYEYIMVWCGITLLVVSWLTIRHLKQHQLPYTFEPDFGDSKDSIRNAEALIISQSLGRQDSVLSDDVKFGGGSFGGGGAGGDH